ncbi:hypothetical protein MVEN_01179900 [Mycena venus]|uniref:Uncharacterized protein n=1 Tax=Mycena venus TaxID=2733690 RepID=A0A8H7CXU5_9AGAR|nr:hypothetical protein MVEN_01179900 [Mycena venus]
MSQHGIARKDCIPLPSGSSHRECRRLFPSPSLDSCLATPALIPTRDNINVEIDSIVYFHSAFGITDLRQALIECAQTPLRHRWCLRRQSYGCGVPPTARGASHRSLPRNTPCYTLPLEDTRCVCPTLILRSSLAIYIRLPVAGVLGHTLDYASVLAKTAKVCPHSSPQFFPTSFTPRICSAFSLAGRTRDVRAPARRAAVPPRQAPALEQTNERVRSVGVLQLTLDGNSTRS